MNVLLQSFEFFRNPSRCFIEETEKLSAKIQGIPVGKPHLNKYGAVRKVRFCTVV